MKTPTKWMVLAAVVAAGRLATCAAQDVMTLPVTDGQLLEPDGPKLSDVLARDGDSVWATRGPVYWRLPESLPAGDYYPCFLVSQAGTWSNDIWNRVRHNGRYLALLGVTDPAPAGKGRLHAELCAERPVRLAGGDVISARIDAGVEALVIRKAPPLGHLKLGGSSWGFTYHQPNVPAGVDVSIAGPPDETRSGTARITVVNYTGAPRAGHLAWQVKDFYGKVLDEGRAHVDVPPLDSRQREIPYRAPADCHHLLITALLDDPAGTLHHTADVVLDRVAGPRPRLYLSGQWDFAAGDPLLLTPLPATNDFRNNAVAVPGYMPLPARGPKHVGWYRKTFEQPDWLTAPRLALCFGTVAYECDVYVNGRKIGNHFGPKDAFEFDVTDVLRPGSNDILVGVRDWVAGAPDEGLRQLAANPEWRTNNQIEIGRLARAANLRAPSWDALGGIKDDVYIEGRADVRIADVFVKPSVRKESLSVDVTLANRSGLPVTVTPVCTILDRGNAVLEFKGPATELAAGAEQVVRMEAQFPDAPLWWPHDPHLLQCRVALDGAQDALDVRFGFREVWLDRNSFLFNGRVAKMTRTGYNPYAPGHMNRRTLREMTAWTPPFGVAIAEVPNSLLMSADICDEEGLLWDLETNVTIVGPTTQLLENDLYWRNAEKLAAAVAKTYRNHACVVHYDHANEFACFAEYTNVKDGREYACKRLFGVVEAVRAVDATRPGHCDADGDLDGRMPDFNLHYPIDGVPGLLVQDRSFVVPVDAFNVWFAQPRTNYVPRVGDEVRVKSNGWPLQWKYGERPVYMPEVLWCPFVHLPHGGTYWKGDSVYRGTYDCYEAERERIMTLMAGHRHIEPWLIHPWTGDGVSYRATRPVCVAPIEALRNYYADQRIERPMNLHHDLLTDDALTLRWGLTWAGGEKPCGEERLDMPAGGIARRRLAFGLPAVTAPTDAALYYRLDGRAGTIDTVTQNITIFPRGAHLPKPVRLALWDPAGKTRQAIADLGVEIVDVEDPARLPEGIPVVVGENAWTEKNVDDTSLPLFEFVRKGGTLLALHQTCWPQWSPAGVRLDAQNQSSRIWKRAPGAPVFEGIADAWLRDWQPAHVVSSHDFVKPVRGNAVALADSGVVDGLERACLLEMRYGKGRILGCQMRLMESMPLEPAAPRMLANLLADTIRPTPARTPAAVYAEPASPLVDLLDTIRAETRLIPRPPAEPAFEGHAVILVQLDGALTVDQARVLRRRAEQGAWVWLRGVTDATLPLVAAVTGLEWSNAGKPLELWEGRGLIEGAPSELAGLSNAEFYWKRGQFGDVQGMELASWKIADIAQTYVRPDVAGMARCLVSPNLMWAVDIGKGKVIVDQVLWAEKVGAMRDVCLRIAAVMLTNAGVPIQPAPRVPVLAGKVDWVPLDLSPYGRFGFADPVESDGQGGWSDQGPRMDMHRLPTGRVRFNDVPFFIDPDQGCLTMRGQHQGDREAVPQHYTGIAVGRAVAAIELLHSVAWGADALEIFRMVVHYADGTERSVPFIGGMNSRDWTSPDSRFPLETETRTRVGWTGPGDVFKQTSVWQSRWVNPEPDKEILTLDFLHKDMASVAMVCVLTLGVDRAGMATEADPRPPQELLEATRAARAAGNPAQAAELAELLCRKSPNATENWNLLGELCLDRQDTRQALQAFRRSLDLQPNQPDIMTRVQQLQVALDQEK